MIPMPIRLKLKPKSQFYKSFLDCEPEVMAQIMKQVVMS